MRRRITPDEALKRTVWNRFTDEEVLMARWMFYEYQCSYIAIREVLDLKFLTESALINAINNKSPSYKHIKDGISEETKALRKGRMGYGIEATESAYAEIIKGASIGS